MEFRSNFEKVVDFNTQFGVIDSEWLNPKTDVIDTNPQTVEFCLKLIREEVRELEEGVQTKDFTEVVDALGDILYVVYGMGARIGVNMDNAFALIHSNNMSKLSPTEQDAIDSVAYYKSHPELGYDSPAYRPSPDGKYFVVFNESTKKILKSISWKAVDLSSVIHK